MQGPTALTANRHAMRRMVARSSRFLQRRPFIGKGLCCATGFAFGDLLTQYFHRPSDDYTHDMGKTAAMFAVGALAATPASLALYGAMDAAWGVGAVGGATSAALAAGKFTVEQVVCCAIWQAAYLSISAPYRRKAAALLRGGGGVKAVAA